MSLKARLSALALSLSAAGLVGIAGWEAFRDTAYNDGVGVQTIGWGSTSGVKPGDKITPDRALVRLAQDAAAIEQQMRACIGDVPLKQSEWDAYVSLGYNIGAGAFCGSTIVRLLKQDPPDYAGACRQISRWIYAGGKVLRGLERRRAAERELCES